MAEPKPSIKDIAYRAVASVLGGPVDLATMAMRPFGYRVPEEQVVGGSEWVGKQMERAGLVSSARAPLKEFLASMISPGGVAKGVAGIAGAAPAMFIGPLAKTWRSDDAFEASKMLKRGEADVDVYSRTGTFRSPDQQLRQEISDAEARLLLDPTKPGGALLKDAIRHPELFQAYPELADVIIETGSTRLAPNTLAVYDPVQNAIEMAPTSDPDRAISTILHELQHGVQKIEGFGQGGNAGMFPYSKEFYQQMADVSKATAKDLLDALNIKKMMDEKGLTLPEAYEKIFGKKYETNPNLIQAIGMSPERIWENYKIVSDRARQNQLIADVGPFEAYRRIKGEAEARATQERMNMDEAERRAVFPLRSYDVDPFNLIDRPE